MKQDQPPSSAAALPDALPVSADRPQHTVKGILLFVLATFLIICMNAFAKMASDHHDPVEVVFYRGIVAMLLLLGFVAVTRRRAMIDVFKTARPLAHLGRSVAGNIGVILIFWAYALLPMADVTAMLFISPLIVTALSVPILGEKVGAWRWSAVLIGFAGVLLIANPGGQGLNSWLFLLPLAAAFFTALVNIFLRQLGRTEDAMTTVFYFLLFGILVTGLYMPFGGQWPQADAVWVLLGAGITGGLSLMIKTEAFRMAEASLLSPFTYTSIVWATLFGWLFWGDLPTLWVITGAAIIIASNLVVAWRERTRARRQ